MSENASTAMAERSTSRANAASSTPPAAKAAKMPRSKHIVVDTEACGGCLTCMLGCSARHFNGECNPELSAIRIDADMLDYRFDAYVCQQCQSASCVAICPKHAIFFDEKTGARCIDRDACVACGACAKSCPLGSEKFSPIRRIEWGGKKLMVKCDLCHGFEDGPYCVQVCPKSAISLA